MQFRIDVTKFQNYEIFESILRLIFQNYESIEKSKLHIRDAVLLLIIIAKLGIYCKPKLHFMVDIKKIRNLLNT